jgi:hypothetical protein
VDASVLLRVALGQPDALSEWSPIERGVSQEDLTMATHDGGLALAARAHGLLVSA